MKKLYFLFIIFCMALANESSGQVYSNVRGGNWSNNGNTPNLATWDANGKPASPCNNCTITIAANTTVTLNESVILKGSSTLILKAGAILKITSSNQNYGGGTLATGHNLILDAASTSKVVFTTTTSKIDASATGPHFFIPIGAGGYYDGVFSSTFTTPTLFSPTPLLITSAKIIGNSAPTTFGQSPFPLFANVPQNFNLPDISITSGSGILSAGGILPVDITSFSAILNDDAVNIAWTVDQQIDFDHFEVTRSSDGGTWQTLGNVAALPTKGVANYSYTDGAPFHGLNYYRLKAVDIDGNFKLSEVALVRGTLINGVQFANPVRNGSLIVSFGADVKSNLAVRLLSTTGQTMQETQVKNPAGSTIALSVGTYAKGIYLLHIKADDGSQKVYKVVVSN